MFAGATDLDPVLDGQSGPTFADRPTSQQLSVQAAEPLLRCHETQVQGWDAPLARLQGYVAGQP